MKRTTIFVPETLEADLQQHARRLNKPTAWVVREAIAAYLATHATPGPRPASVGLGASGRADVSERFEELLFADRASGHRKRSRAPARRAGPRRRTGAR